MGHSLYISGSAHPGPDDVEATRDAWFIGNIVIQGEGYAYHAWHSPMSVTLAGNFSSGNFWSVVLQGPNHSCHHNVFWKPIGDISAEGQGPHNAWLPSPLRRFDHNIFGADRPIWGEVRMQKGHPPVVENYSLKGRTVEGAELKLLTKPVPWFPRTEEEVDKAIYFLDRYFFVLNPEEISKDTTDRVEKAFAILKPVYTPTAEDTKVRPISKELWEDKSFKMH